MTVLSSPAAPTISGTQHVVLLGAGLVHVQALAQLATKPLAGTVVTLVAPHPRQLNAGMVPGFMAGHYTLDDCAIPLEPLVQRSGIRWVQHSAVGLDVQQQTLQLDDGSTLHFDWLSINTDPIQDRDQLEKAIPGVREHALFARPIEAFAALWPRVVEMGSSRALRVAVIGGGSTGIELALAVRHRLPNAAVTLVSSSTVPGANYPTNMRQRLHNVLKMRRVTVIQDLAVGLTANAVQLGCGADLACDVPILATGGAQPPAWLAASGLALDDHGFIAVDRYLRSTSHSRVFAMDNVGTCSRHPLVQNLAAAMAGSPLQPHQPPIKSLNILSCGDRYAVASWGHFSAQGWWVWRLKDWMDRRFMARSTQQQG
ncbi:FAD-dependent oxidoreductase [Candidatus Aalborgicola defluviihabitans]|jgi:NADH dehydrogenase FAD-containing subunit|uniref:FAD-dependent oxidoreductase n=1 Tax=Candidatus Aalborgicola defluviihabitans TaxID=3386187 RepID=UPI001EC45EF9|nr:FAD-dependent oxidoreductase [Burkholderiales bacterium]